MAPTHKVFVSWSGEAGNKLATALRDTVLTYPNLNPWVSSVDIHAGQAWFQAIDTALASAAVGVVLLSPCAQASPWLNFEAGYLYARLKSCIVLQCGEIARGPLEMVQASDALDQDSLIRALCSILIKSGLSRSEEQAKKDAGKWVRMHWMEWSERAKQEIPKSDDLDKIATDLVRRVEKLPDNPLVQRNECMRRIVAMSLQQLHKASDTETRHEIAAVHYPHYLLSLQRLGARVRALALLEREEFFWLLNIGCDLARTAHPDSERTFIFDNTEQLGKYYEILRLHAAHYKVFAICRDDIAKIIPASKDFSVIMLGKGGIESASAADLVLAEYDPSPAVTVIRFESETACIKQHLEYLDDVQKAAVPVSKDEPLDRLREEVFGPTFVQYTRRPVEMSEYISVQAYDQHEEKHAYYVDMMSRMIDIVSTHRVQSAQTSCRILEFGAGTGILTRRLAGLDGVELHVVEIDWHCYQVLVDKFRQSGARLKEFTDDGREHHLETANGNLVVTHNEDSRRYNPPGKFNYILSSFADHHIKASDKRLYFTNVRQNLLPGALFVVGDEFLREHDSTNEGAWKAALKVYHEHIIQIARDAGEHVLATLEEQAYRSGLERRGDFKMSLNQYKDLLSLTGFVIECECIGPANPSETGGVYVCTARVAG